MDRQSLITGQSVALGWKIIRRGSRLIYDYVGFLMVINALWFAIGLLPPVFFGTAVLNGVVNPVAIGLLLVTLLFLFSPATAAVYSLTADIVHKGDVPIRAFFSRFRRYFWKSALLTAALVGFIVIIGGNFWFYVSRAQTVLKYLSGIFLYVFLFWAMLLNYVYPLLVQQDVGLWKLLQRAVLIVLDNLVVTGILLVLGFVLAGVSVVFQVPLFLFFMGVLGFYHNVAFVELIKKYDSDGDSDKQGV